MMRPGWLFLVATAGAAVACSSDNTGPALAQCSTSLASALTLAVGAYTAIDPATDSGCVSFPANVSGTSAEYLVIAQSAGGVPGDSAPFALQSANLSASLVAPATVGSRRAQLHRRGPIAMRFDRFLHERERAQRRATRSAAGLRAVRAAVLPTPPVVGSLRTFTVCSNYDCSVYKPVTARARAVGAHTAIYVDTLAPPNGLDSAQIDSLRQTFDTHAYVVDTVAFGSLSDLDNNGLVITLMTPVVNSMVSAAECYSGGFIAGFFDPADLDPATATHHNDGEIFYTVVADPNGALSCAHTVADLESFLPSTLLHELQHVISFNQHVLLRDGDQEDLWLDEALSSLAEELGGESFLPDQNTFFEYVFNDLASAYSYLQNPGAHFLLQTSDTVLEDFGAGWLYARFLVDQFGPSLTSRLEQTALTGAANVAMQTNLPFETTTTRWALANFVSDLPGFAPPAGVFYRSWSFRQTFASFNQQDPEDFPQQFPLVPPTAGGALVSVSGKLHAGSGYYVEVVQQPGSAGFALRFNGAPGAISPDLDPRLAVIRLQ